MITRPGFATALALAACLAGTARPAAAQAARDLQVSIGYVYLNDPTIDVAFHTGWDVSVAKGLNGWLSIAAGYDDSRRTIPTVAGDLTFGVRTMMAGSQFSARLGRATEFGQLLAGVVRSTGSAFGAEETSTHTSVQAGAGIDFPLSRRVAFRIELDYRVFPGGTSNPGHQVRGLAGLTFTVR